VAANGIPTVGELEAHIGEPGGGHAAALGPILAGVLDMISQRARGAYIGPARSTVAILSGGRGRAPRLPDSPGSYPRGRLSLYLPHPPAPDEDGAAVTLVEVRDTPNGDWRALDATDWELEGRLLRRRGVEWPPFASSVRVTYLAGYDAASPMPAAVRLGALDGAAAEWRQRVRANPGLEVLEPGSAPRMPKTFWLAVDAVTPPPEAF